MSNQIETEISRLNAKLEGAAFYYHVLSKPVLSDEIYDSLFHKLVDLEKKYPEFKIPNGITSRVGAPPIAALKTVRHQRPLLSLKNIFDAEDIASELPLLPEKYTTYIANGKLDGLALSIIYKAGVLKRAVTRGDGEEGEDVTAAAMLILNIPKTLPNKHLDVEVRGEVVIPKKAFIKLNERLILKGKEPYANTRNAVSGILRSLKPDEIANKPLAFFVYGVMDWHDKDGVFPPTSLSEAMEKLVELGFSHKRYYLISTDTPEGLGKWVSEIVSKFTGMREDYDVDIDGVVFAYNNFIDRVNAGHTTTYPKFAMAYKFPPSMTTSTLLSTLWQVGRTGAITPVAQIVPVTLRGVTISRVTLHNLAEINRLNIKEGDTIIVTRRGDVIPKIEGVLADLRTGEETFIKIPSECPSCSEMTITSEDKTFLFCVNGSCNAQLITRLEHFASREAMNIKGLGAGIIKLLVDKALLTSIFDIYQLKDERAKLEKIEGFGETSIDNLLDAIEKSKKTQLHRLIYGLGIPGVGESTSRNLCKHFRWKLDKISDASIERLKQIDDIGDVTAESIQTYFSHPVNREQLDKLSEIISWENDINEVRAQWFEGQNWVVTGSFDFVSRDEWATIIRERGGTITGSVSGKTNYLLAGFGTENGDKTKKAKALGVRIVGEREFAQAIELARNMNESTIGFF